MAFLIDRLLLTIGLHPVARIAAAAGLVFMTANASYHWAWRPIYDPWPPVDNVDVTLIDHTASPGGHLGVQIEADVRRRDCFILVEPEIRNPGQRWLRLDPVSGLEFSDGERSALSYQIELPADVDLGEHAYRGRLSLWCRRGLIRPAVEPYEPPASVPLKFTVARTARADG